MRKERGSRAVFELRTVWGYVKPGGVGAFPFAPELEVYSIDESFLDLTA